MDKTFNIGNKNEYYEALAIFEQKSNEIINLVNNDNTSIELLINKMKDLITNYTNLYKVLDNFKFDTMNNLLPKMHEKAQKGWLFYYLYDIREIEDLLYLDDLTFEESIIKLLSENDYLLIRILTSNYTKYVLLNTPFDLFNKALSCLYNNNYYSFICSMFPLIENTLIQTNVFSNLEHQTDFRIKITQFMTEMDYKFFNNVWNDIDLYLQKIFNGFKRNKSNDIEFVNRNKIEHGFFDRECTFKDCLQILFLYISMLEVIQIMSLINMNDKLNELENLYKL